jgi:DNA-binding LacI/PurR family transcriptional regulator
MLKVGMARSSIKKEPLWLRALGELRSGILSDPTKKGEKFPSLADISKSFGISMPTAVKVVSSLEAEGLVRSIRGKGTFIVGSSFPGTIKVIVDIVEGWSSQGIPHVWNYLQGIQEACRQAKCRMELISSDHIEECAAKDDRFILIQRIQGELISTLERLELRFVCLHSPMPIPGVDTVRLDIDAGARMEIEHLLGLGHRRIALLSGPFKSPWYASRPRIYMELLEKAGIPFDPALIIEGPGFELRDEEPIGALLDRVMALPSPPTAIAASDDLRAVTALKFLKTRGVDVPGQVSICGLDARSEAFDSKPPLTTVDWLMKRQGEIAVRTLLDERRGKPKDVLIQPQLIVGKSSARAPASA